MKKIYSIALLALAALFTLTSCNKGELDFDETPGTLTKFVACIDADESRTSIDGFKINWNAGDEINVNGVIFVATPDETDPTKAEFNLKEGQTAPTGTTIRAYYPSSAFISTQYYQRFKLQGTVLYDGNDMSTISYMYAQLSSSEFSETPVFTFKHVTGLLAIDLVGDETVTSIKVTAPTSNYLYGTISNLAYSSAGVISYSSFTTSGRGTSVTLDCGKGVALDETKPERFYIPIPQKNYTKLTLAISTASGKTKTIASTKACNVEKGKLYTLPEFKVSFPVLTFNATVSVSDLATTAPTTSSATMNVVPEDKEQYYMYAIESPGYVGQFSTPLELAQADIDYWKSQGATSLQQLINAGLAVKGDLSESFNSLSPSTSYVPYAYAIDEDFNVSPAIIASEFTTPEYVRPVVSAKYEDYLGQWVFGTNLVTISEKVSGVSYSISGLKYQSYPAFGYENAPVEAKFDEGYFLLDEQITGTVVPVSSYGDCDIVLSGEFSQGTSKYKYYPFNGDTPQTIFMGVFDGDKTIKVTPLSCPYGDFGAMCFSWVIKSGTNKGKGNYFETMPLVDMTKYEEPTGDTPEGQWLCPSVTNYWGDETYTNWVIDIQSSGAGFVINNFDQGFDEFLETQVSGLRSTPPTAVWNASAGTLTVATGTETGISASTNIYWTGRDGNTDVDIVLNFDFAAKTCKYSTALWGAFLPDETDPGFYSFYNGPDMVYTKVENSATVKANQNIHFGGTIPFVSSYVKKAPFAVSSKRAASRRCIDENAKFEAPARFSKVTF